MNFVGVYVWAVLLVSMGKKVCALLSPCNQLRVSFQDNFGVSLDLDSQHKKRNRFYLYMYNQQEMFRLVFHCIGRGF